MLTSAINWRDSFEVYHFFVANWDVNQARRFIEQNPREVDTCNVTKSPVGMHQIDHDKVDGVDLSIPLIIVPIFEKKERIGVWVIDGWHRIAKAKRENISSLPCVMMTEDEAEKIRIN